MLSDFETQAGGAAIAASRLAEAYVQAGQQVTRIVSYPDGHEHAWNTVALAPSLWAWGALRRLPGIVAQPFSAWEHGRNLTRMLKTLQPDIINIHNLHGALANGWSFDLLQVCVNQSPVVWTLHDMWSFTGRCVHSMECDKYLRGCDQTCPTPFEYPALAPEKIEAAWQQRASFLREHPKIIAVSPSNWLAKLAAAGLWRNNRVEVIPNGVPLEIFRQIDLRIARQAFGIDPQGMVILLAGTKLDHQAKGGAIVGEALGKLPFRPITLVTMGANPPQLQLPEVDVHHLGYVDNERIKALAYAAADLYLHPSLADNLPLTIIESIACGTPVLAFSVGGVVELVRPGFTGWLCENISASALATVLNQALVKLSSGINLSLSCREVANGEYGLDLQSRRYLGLFQRLL